MTQYISRETSKQLNYYTIMTRHLLFSLSLYYWAALYHRNPSLECQDQHPLLHNTEWIMHSHKYQTKINKGRGFVFCV